MGQYRQWLEYQEIHKRLSSQVGALEAELAKLQVSVDRLGPQHEIASITDNPIMQALIIYMTSQSAPFTRNARHSLEVNNPSETVSDESGNSIPPGLRSWRELPNFELYENREPGLVDNRSLPFYNRPEIELSPEDMIAFLDGHEQTDPQLELPWWLRNITVSSKDEHAGRPIDHNSIRTNRLVQRWIERWGRKSSTALESTENKEEGSGE